MSDGTNSLTFNSSATTGVYTISYGLGTDAVVSVGGVQAQLVTQKTEQGINPALYFRFVKSKFTKTQQERLKTRLKKLQKLIPYAKDMGQQALYEELSKELVGIIKESAIEAVGCDTYITKDKIEKFRKVKDKVVKFDVFENFPRVIPKKVQLKLKKIKAAQVFDSFHILYMDLTDEKLKSTSQKIQEKDPILFGCINNYPDRFYYIADWEDEYCDLTLDKFIDTMKTDDADFSIDHIEDLTEESFAKIKEEVVERTKRLADTNMNTWRDKIREEEKAKLQAELSTEQKAAKTLPWWKRLLGVK